MHISISIALQSKLAQQINNQQSSTKNAASRQKATFEKSSSETMAYRQQEVDEGSAKPGKNIK